MYPGIACNKIIPVFKTNDNCFKENDEKAALPSLISPSVNIGSSDEAYLITIATPGLNKEDFQIKIEDAVISISANKEKIQSIFKNDRCEYDYTAWTRAFRLPQDADAIMTNAEYVNGELIIHIPKSDSSENKEYTIIHVY
jgi:HSP20 family protein